MGTIKIHRGTNQIGGSITEIASSTTRIFIDFGADLPAEGCDSTDYKMIELMLNNPPDAVLFTHYHGDHTGLLSYIPDTVKIYIGEVARNILLNIRETLLNVEELENDDRKRLNKEYEILKSDQIVTYNKNKQPMLIGDITFIPYMVDHSAYDAYMFRIHCDGEVIVHTGDFRNHGRLGKMMLPMIRSEVSAVYVDYLIIEGTMMSRSSEKIMTESDMQEEAKDLFTKNKYVFLICSSTNMDSLASFYNAARCCKNKKVNLYTNRYVKKQLDLYTNTAGKFSHVFQFRHSYKIEDGLQKDLIDGRTQEEYMREEGFVMLVGYTDYYKNLISKFEDLNPILIYSMWDGYIKKGPNFIPELKNLVDLFDDNHFINLHTSGHASISFITEVIKEINPRKEIIPIHTENAEAFKDLDISEELRNKIALYKY